MVDLRAYEKLHTILMLKELIRRWWGVELAFADSRGYVLDHADGKIIPPANDYCRAALFSKDGFRRCNESVRNVRDKLRGASTRARSAVLHECHMGFDLVAAPIQLDGELAGFLFVGGSVREDPAPSARLELSRRARELAPGTGAIEPSAAKVPLLNGADLEHLMDLLEFGAQQVALYHAENRANAQERAPVAVGAPHRFDAIIGSAPPMQAVFRLLEKIVESDSTILIQGESGTGKELVARAIHYNGPRAKRAFVVQNCSAFNDNLLESALFGHTKGSFTGAIKDKKGLFEVADGGTFFLDEIGDMSAALQVKLLRVLQEGTFTPVGATEVREVDVRVIAATHKDLHKMVERSEFREDLYYRINVIKVLVPPLRDRMEDLPILIDYFMKKHHRSKAPLPRVSAGALAALQRYPWPGNIRELENEIERLLVLGAELDELPADLLSARVRDADLAATGGGVVSGGRPLGGTGPRAAIAAGAAGAANGGANLKDAVEALEREMIQQGLIRTHWNKSQLAKELGISRSNLIQKCAYYGLDRKD